MNWIVDTEMDTSNNLQVFLSKLIRVSIIIQLVKVIRIKGATNTIKALLTSKKSSKIIHHNLQWHRIVKIELIFKLSIIKVKVLIIVKPSDEMETGI